MVYTLSLARGAMRGTAGAAPKANVQPGQLQDRQ